MAVKQLQLYSINDIKNVPGIVKHSNAFILPDGYFYLAKGYTGCNPAHQLESSALSIARNVIGKDIKTCFNSYVDEQLMTSSDEQLIKRFNNLPGNSLYNDYYSYIDEVRRYYSSGSNFSGETDFYEKLPRFRYLRTILVHYYGYALFARQERVRSGHEKMEGKPERYFDFSIVPNPAYYGESLTEEQLEVLESLWELNDDGTFEVATYEESSKSQFEKVLAFHGDGYKWNL